MFFDDLPYPPDFWHNDHFLYFGELFRKICAIPNLSQNRLSDFSKLAYGELIKAKVLEPGANIGSLAQDSLSRVQSGQFRPTLQQVRIWFDVVKAFLKEAGLEFVPSLQVEQDFYLLALGGTFDQLSQAIDRVRKIEHEQTPIVRNIRKKRRSLDDERNTDLEIPVQREPRSDMLIGDIDKVRAAIQKIMEKERQG